LGGGGEGLGEGAAGGSTGFPFAGGVLSAPALHRRRPRRLRAARPPCGLPAGAVRVGPPPRPQDALVPQVLLRRRRRLGTLAHLSTSPVGLIIVRVEGAKARLRGGQPARQGLGAAVFGRGSGSGSGGGGGGGCRRSSVRRSHRPRRRCGCRDRRILSGCWWCQARWSR
ncbi:unnamed protein product, partial [Ectocarpus sp. 8 AP-2014]